MKNKKKLSYERVKSRYGYVFISLWLIGFVLFFLFPFFEAIRYSFSDMTIKPGQVILENIGFANYTEALFEDANFLPAFVESVGSVIARTPLIILFSLFVAIILNQKFRGRTFFRAIFFLPVIITSGVVIDIINSDSLITMIMSGERAAMMFENFSTEKLLSEIGLETTVSSFIIETVNEILNLTWYSGIQILIFIAGLQSINPSLYEVSKVEGATAWDNFWKITIPMLAPMILINIIYTIIDIFVNYSNPTFKYISEIQGKTNFQLASSMAIICFIFIFVLVGLVYLVLNKHIFYQND